MILRKPFGFAFIYMLVAAVLGVVIQHINMQLPELLAPFVAGIGFLLIFTLIYIFVVKAHLSHHFRIYASLYLALLGIVATIAAALLQSQDLGSLLLSPYTWLNPLVYFIVAYLVISLANWIAGFFFKSKGHI
jgi:hypothetical protein